MPGTLAETDGGERGIRTLEGLLTLTPLAGVRLRPLGHLSGCAKAKGNQQVMAIATSPPSAAQSYWLPCSR
jgi:hypothetical protein